MHKLRPCKFELHLIYNCPKCNSPHWLIPIEAKTKNFKFSCCDNVFTVEQINDIKVNINFVKSDQSSDPIGKVSAEGKILNEAFKILSAYGYKKTEIKQFHKKSYCQSAESLIKSFLRSK